MASDVALFFIFHLCPHWHERAQTVLQNVDNFSESRWLIKLVPIHSAPLTDMSRQCVVCGARWWWNVKWPKSWEFGRHRTINIITKPHAEEAEATTLELELPKEISSWSIVWLCNVSFFLLLSIEGNFMYFRVSLASPSIAPLPGTLWHKSLIAALLSHIHFIARHRRDDFGNTTTRASIPQNISQPFAEAHLTFKWGFLLLLLMMARQI